ncbi:MAG TPA: selenide, water dikinase SelD [Bacteroidia bacterium]|jgi:selenide,water dikinase|nr:selenide, water dikinase SelD [Bacteroidia bacterium]
MENIKLTQYSKASGCGCKIAPAVLQEILKTDYNFVCKELLVGNKTNDDAAVYDLGNEQCLISTTDFFMPVVNSPFDFGRVAATNAISDVYAMGGKPIMAIAILGWPTEKLGTQSAKEVLEGARKICAEAGIPLAGGHSIESTEPIFGLAVNGIVEKKNLKQNNTLNEGDNIYLTKSLGTGIYSTALKRDVLKEEDYSVLINSMCELNSLGFELGKLPYVSAITDVTGFGFLGHLLEMIGEKNVTAVIEKNKIKTFENLNFYTSQFIFPDNTTRNFNAYEKEASGMVDLDFMKYCDPQTSGGLLFTVNSANENEFEKWLKEKNYSAFKVGKVEAHKEKKVHFI